MKKKPHILVLVNGLIPSVIIGIIKPFLELQQQDEITFKVALARFYRKSQLHGVDLVVFCRNVMPTELRILNDLACSQIPYIYELDDNFFAIDTKTSLGQFYRQPASIYSLKKFIQRAALVRVYNQVLADRCGELNTKIALMRAYFDFSLLAGGSPEKHKKIKIVYATSRHKFDSSQTIFLTALAEIAKKYAAQVEIYFWGTNVQDDALSRLPNVFNLPPVLNYAAFIKQFYAMNFDIGLAPLENDEFHNSKTNNKYREYGACGVAGVYSKVALYQQCIQNEENGLLVENVSEQWFAALERLILDASLREKIKTKAQDDVRQHYTLQNQIYHWRQHIAQVLDEKKPTSETLQYTIVSLREFSSRKIIRQLPVYSKLCLTKTLPHVLAYQKGYRNFCIYLHCKEQIARFQAFTFYPDARYLVVDTYHYIIATQMELPANVHVIDTEKIGSSLKMLDLAEKWSDARVNPFVKEYEWVFDHFLIKNQATNVASTFGSNFKNDIEEKISQLFYFLYQFIQSNFSFVKKIWWYRNHIIGVIKINFLKK